MFLDEAMSAARKAALERMAVLPVAMLEEIISSTERPPDFKGALMEGNGKVSVIAEVKRMSPSAGVIREGVGVGGIVSEYESAGASAVSIITSGYKFGGCLADLEEARKACKLPLLRKDFVSKPYQVLESRAYGASAVLLISDALEADILRGLASYSRELGMETLVESHSREGLEKALQAGAEIIGINNRNLETLEVDTTTTERLLPYVPRGTVVVSESGIKTRECVRRMARLGVDALLIGEELMRAPRPGRRLAELLEEVDESCG